MTPSRPRRLAAVWFADIVGYSALSARDEDAALALVRTLQDAARDEAAAREGRVVKFSGDGALAVFASVDGALQAALEMQRRFGATEAGRAHGAALRVGLHLGQVTEEADGDVYGDGVNVAARLQQKARPGEILVSRAVKEMLRGRPGFAFHRTPMWHHLKGLGLTRVFVATDADVVRPPSRRLPARAVGVGLAAGIAGFLFLMSQVAMQDGAPFPPDVPGEAAAPDAATAAAGDVRLDLGVEHYFARELDEVEEALSPFLRPPLSQHPEARRALRYLARALHEGGKEERARSTLDRLVAAEPPMALLIPSAESDGLMALYYEARRAVVLKSRPAQDGAPRPVSGVMLFDLQVALDREDPDLEALGASVATMLGSELEAAGIPTGYLWEVTVGVTGEGAYQRMGADRPGGRRESHALLGRVAVRGDEVAVSAQVYDLATGDLVAAELLTGAWPDGFLDLVVALGAGLSAELGPAGE